MDSLRENPYSFEQTLGSRSENAPPQSDSFRGSSNRLNSVPRHNLDERSRSNSYSATSQHNPRSFFASNNQRAHEGSDLTLVNKRENDNFLVNIKAQRKPALPKVAFSFEGELEVPPFIIDSPGLPFA